MRGRRGRRVGLLGRALTELARLDYCYLTTRGRVTGKPHTIEIWFGLERDTLYLMSGGRDRSDWVKNLLADPAVEVRVGDETFNAAARVVEDPEEDALTRRVLVEKYASAEDDLSEWGRTALPIALDLSDERS
ncbi:MAG: nitroreductase/quinone reductase family protein [Actinomycetota bacterium]